MRPTVSSRLTPLQTKRPGELLVHEIYRSVQGESTFAGFPCVLVRLAVCDARCVWCDTPHAFNQGTSRSLAAVRERVLELGCPLVEITGGEPLLQPEVFQLMTDLLDQGLTVLLETSGAHDIRPVDRRVHIVMDLKCPDSGECPGNRWTNLEFLKRTDEIKFVIASETDFRWSEETIRKHRLDHRFSVLLSPVFGAVLAMQLAQWLLASGLHVRMQLQMHKQIWDPHARGV